MVQINFKKLTEGSIIPTYGRTGDAAMDMYANEDCVIEPGKRQAIGTGVASSFPEGFVLLYRGRSGLAFKQGINPLAGVIDSNYRGEHKVILHNTGHEDLEVKKGDRIAQAILFKLPTTEILEVEDLEENTERGAAGFGSSGR